MYVLYEDKNQFKAEKVFSRAERSLQVESATGKRTKMRQDRVFLTFNTPAPEILLEQARQLANDIDIDFLWECAPENTFSAVDFAKDYFGEEKPTAVQQAALIFALHAAPAYFHRRGAGKYRAAPEETLKAALAAIERRRQEEKQQQNLTQAMLKGELPEEIANIAEDLLLQPDKNSIEWKAFQAALKERKCSPEQLLLELNAWSSPLALHRQQFFSEYFPNGLHFPLPTPNFDLELKQYPLAEVTAYSIDDAGTTEIDDAFSVTPLGDNLVRVGIHIAVPALKIARDSKWDKLARTRMATVYMPGEKIPMLPEDLISQFSLLENTMRPALSLYVDFNLSDGTILQHDTRIERVCVEKNLTHDDLAEQATKQALEDPQAALPYANFLRPLWAIAQHLRKEREETRGWPEQNGRTEYLFRLEGPSDNPNSTIHLIARNRQAPLSILTAEFMILANRLWAGLLKQYELPAAFRSQQNMRTRMSTHAMPHKSIGVPYYLWGTSPLRRYIDLVNQRQIIAAAKHGVSARLAAPYKPREADLYALISAFESQYSAWNQFQNKIERYWSLRWLIQQQKKQLKAQYLRQNLIRFIEAPLVTKISGLPDNLERHQELIVDILDIDEVNLDVDCRLVEIAPLATAQSSCSEEPENTL